MGSLPLYGGASARSYLVSNTASCELGGSLMVVPRRFGTDEIINVSTMSAVRLLLCCMPPCPPPSNLCRSQACEG